MLYLDDPGLDTATARGLRKYQEKVDSAGPYAGRMEAGKRLFSHYNRRKDPVFRVVRERLADMCSGARRCSYCEDSAGDEIEHVKPKDLYPDRVFVWENYLLACGPCNGGKNNRFSVIRDGRLVDVTRPRGAPARRPGGGVPAPINPRDEDPLSFLDLAIVDTFMFLPREGLPDVDELRADYTIDVLKLNREVLLVARREAYGAYRARLHEYRGRRDVGGSEAELGLLRDAIRTSAHPTVWREMQRQWEHLDELHTLFEEVPEALTW